MVHWRPRHSGRDQRSSSRKSILKRVSEGLCEEDWGDEFESGRSEGGEVVGVAGGYARRVKGVRVQVGRVEGGGWEGRVWWVVG